MNFFKRVYAAIAWRYRRLFPRKVFKVKDLGISNRVVVGRNLRGGTFKVFFHGNNNTVTVGDDCIFLQSNTIFITGNNNNVSIGRNTSFDQKVLLVACEGTNITIGEDCMFAAGVTLRTSDQHTIYNGNGKRINHAADINIGNHVWCGANVVVMKGVQIGRGTMVGYGSVVTKPLPECCMAVGSPARVIKENISWSRKLE